MNVAISTVSPHELSTRLVQGETLHLIDVRTPPEFETAHADGARLVPLDRFDTAEIDSLLGLKTEETGHEPIYLVCQSGMRATQAAQKLLQIGYSNVHVVDGGTEGLASAGHPINRGRESMSLQRQVQITIGSLVILMVILGFTFSPVFFGLVAFMGGGLVFAGVTQTCAMAQILARMPWNQKRTCDATAS